MENITVQTMTELYNMPLATVDGFKTVKGFLVVAGDLTLGAFIMDGKKGGFKTIEIIDTVSGTGLQEGVQVTDDVLKQIDTEYKLQLFIGRIVVDTLNNALEDAGSMEKIKEKLKISALEVRLKYGDMPMITKAE